VGQPQDKFVLGRLDEEQLTTGIPHDQVNALCVNDNNLLIGPYEEIGIKRFCVSPIKKGISKPPGEGLRHQTLRALSKSPQTAAPGSHLKSL
jgi:hypothetical protein